MANTDTHLTVRPGPDAGRQIGAQVARMIRQTATPAPVRPIVPRPLWERRDLFQEPVYAAGLDLLEDDSEDEGGESIITP